jgi:hypothetical protein
LSKIVKMRLPLTAKEVYYVIGVSRSEFLRFKGYRGRHHGFFTLTAGI